MSRSCCAARLVKEFKVGRKTYGLVHDAEYNLGVRLVFRSQLAPETRKIFVGRTATTLADNLAVPAGIIVDVDYAELGTSVYAALHESIVGLEIGAVECAAQLVVDEVLPCDW
jgi:hypothetical protein